MLHLAKLRLSGHFKDRWIMKEKDALIESEKKIEKNRSIHRPVGLLRVSDLRGRNLRSRELGLPGSFYASVFYDPVRYANENMKSSLTKCDASNSCIHEIGATVSPGITANPIWTNMRESTELMRLKHLLPDDRLWGEQIFSEAKGVGRDEKVVVSSIQYPILQPIAEDDSFRHEEGDRTTQTGVQLMPWKSSFGAVVIQVRFSDVLGPFQVFDNVLGEVVVPLAKLAGGQEVEGWFRLLDVGTKDTVPGESSDDDIIADMKSHAPSTEKDSNLADDEIPSVTFPELYLRVKFSQNATYTDHVSSSDDESSKVIYEEMVRSASMTPEGGIGVIGSSLSTLNTVRSLGGKLQNQISYVINIIEQIRNAFNFSVRMLFWFFICCVEVTTPTPLLTTLHTDGQLILCHRIRGLQSFSSCV